MKKRTYKSRVIAWKTEKGYGFLANPVGEEDLFLHINDIQGKEDPCEGDTVQFELYTNQNGKPAVQHARLLKLSTMAMMSWIATLALSIAPFILSFASISKSRLPLVLYACMSTLCFWMVKSDKTRSIRGDWRIPDSSICLTQFLWGWPGSLIAQKLYFHKINKRSFQGTLKFTLFIHLLFWADYLVLGHFFLDRIILALNYLTHL